MTNVRPLSIKRYRSIWISDVHLGFRGCSADFLLDFLHATESKFLYLVGDIVDMWSLKKQIYWPQSHSNVIRTILGKAKHGTEVIYIPGNHDEIFRDQIGLQLGNLKIRGNFIHTAADGKKFLVAHGDEYDAIVTNSKTIALLGSKLYDWLLQVNYVVNYIRRKLGFRYWSLAAALKHRVKNAVSYISNFETVIAHEARKQQVDGLICGHIHHAEISEINGILYCNAGDWVESRTALVEHFNGRIELLRWSDAEKTIESLKSEPIRAAA